MAQAGTGPTSLHPDVRVRPIRRVVRGSVRPQPAIRAIDVTLNESAPTDNTLIPTECASGLVLDHARLEEVALLLEIDHLAHPRERVHRTGIENLHSDLLASPVGDEAQVLLEHRRIQPENPPRHRVLSVAVFELDRAPH